MQQPSIFLISPVQRITSEERKRLAGYVQTLEASGARVHWPIRNTEQDDPTGGYRICRENCHAIISADEVHIWYNETSGGSKFDMGVLFVLIEMLGWSKRVVIANDAELVESEGKSFLKVMRRLIEARNLS